MHLEKTAKGDDNLCLVFKKYSMDFRDYLRNHRDPLVLPLILQQVVEGLIQLHSLGYTHRDLKPENILLNLDPLEVRINDFSTATLTTQRFTGSVKGSAGYVPY
jgi:serine/threonine protein kinase